MAITYSKQTSQVFPSPRANALRRGLKALAKQFSAPRLSSKPLSVLVPERIWQRHAALLMMWHEHHD